MQHLQTRAARKKKRTDRELGPAQAETIPSSITGDKDGRAAPHGHGTGVRRPSDAKRAAILRGAKRVFLAEGFERASMDEVAAKSGVAKMTVYRHFGSKEDLFAGVIADLCNRIVAQDLERIFEQAPEKALRRYAERMITIVFDRDTIELHRIVVAETRLFPELGRYFYAYGPQVCIDALARYFECNRANPRFRITDPVRTAEEFLELLRGYAHLRVMLKVEPSPSRAEMAKRVRAAVAHVLRG
jgi:TetR/AcrR family transcriptional regulator, mexJK operon transcriptional repressor